MYSTKTIHKNINPNYPQGYTSIGDPYRGNNERLPSRWKEKQFVTQKFPKNAENGLFVKLRYNSEPYTETGEKYSKTQPIDQRKLGFGSRDASKTGEFTCWKTTERYRSVVKQEALLMESHRDEAKEKAVLEKIPKSDPQPPKDRDGKSLEMPVYMYDIGRNTNTFGKGKSDSKYDPKTRKDCFYNIPKHSKEDIRRLGSHRPSSTVIGQYAWAQRPTRPTYGSNNGVEKFFDRGHLEVKGF